MISKERHQNAYDVLKDLLSVEINDVSDNQQSAENFESLSPSFEWEDSDEGRMMRIIITTQVPLYLQILVMNGQIK